MDVTLNAYCLHFSEKKSKDAGIDDEVTEEAEVNELQKATKSKNSGEAKSKLIQKDQGKVKKDKKASKPSTEEKMQVSEDGDLEVLDDDELEGSEEDDLEGSDEDDTDMSSAEVLSELSDDFSSSEDETSRKLPVTVKAGKKKTSGKPGNKSNRDSSHDKAKSGEEKGSGGRSDITAKTLGKKARKNISKTTGGIVEGSKKLARDFQKQGKTKNNKTSNSKSKKLKKYKKPKSSN